ncbi:3-keto-disaccharide hydrolase [Sphingobacterium sp. LRF_L2]|uniref:3-keto-disaccharide hydrolase n=1 Tax=Sphingobacterium sp. LRF_L2 TaxID=3369421 RepID=UPI003F5E073D
MKRKFIYAISAVMLLVAVSSKAQNKNVVATDVPPYEILNLPKVDIKKFPKNADGAYVIFDGKSLDGWRGYNKEKVPAKWSIEDGTLKFSKNPVGVTNPDGGDLVFAYDFKNFELEFDWKISQSGNSGVFFLAKEVKDQPIYISSPEYQLLDNENHPDAKMGVDGNRKSGSLYDMIPAIPQNGNPAGEWNKAKIVVNKGKVTHYQNGVKVVEYDLWTPAWTALLQESKFSQTKWPLAFALLNQVGGKTKSGVIGFQDHGDDVWLKNITVKVL